MPLLKKTPFSLLEPPEDLNPHERVFQVRFTKEIFRDYEAYLNRINLYRQRVWTCKISGKINLTYEEALVSERNAIEKVQEIPKEFVEPALRIIQFSMLSLKDLADAVVVMLQDRFTVGADLDGRKGGTTCPCKLLKVLPEKTAKPQYEVAWLDKNKKVIETAVVNGEDLSWRKFPLSRGIMKSFIRESTYRSAPWVLHDKLAEKYGISKDPPKELKDKIVMQNGLVICNNKRKKETEEESGRHKRKNVENGKLESEEDDELQREAIKYPIEDMLVQPGADDPVFSERPIPSRDFNVPMECVGDLLMVWDFCSSFGRFLHLSPFSLEDFENAICHKDSNLILIVEVHSALLRILIKDSNGHFSSVKEKSQKLKKISLVTWTEYICDFLETTGISDLSNCMSMIKRGHYGLLGAEAKLGILRELVNQALETGLLREKLDEFIEQITELNATIRIEALEEARNKREEKGQLKTDTVANGDICGNHTENGGKDQSHSLNENHSSQDGVLAGETGGGTVSSQHKRTDEISGTNLSADSSKGKKQIVDGAEQPGNTNKLSRKEVPKMKEKKTTETRSKEQRKEYLEREMEKRFLRTNSLGKDRYHNRYWWFKRDARIFVESSDSKLWGYYSSKEEVNSLIGSLNCKGVRERALHRKLNNLYSRISSELDKRSKDLANKIAMDEAVLRRSTRVRAMPREMTANAFLRYVNKWKED